MIPEGVQYQRHYGEHDEEDDDLCNARVTVSCSANSTYRALAHDGQVVAPAGGAVRNWMKWSDKINQAVFIQENISCRR